MSDSAALQIGFTEVLYGVVVANAIYQLEFALVFRNYMLLLAFAFILGDWIEYQISLGEVPSGTSNYVAAFVLDVVILIVWYFLTIIPASELDWFFVIAGVFFLLQASWDWLLLGLHLRALVSKPHLQLTAVFVGFAVLYRYTTLEPIILLVAAAIAFLARKFPRWRVLVRKSPGAI